MRRIGLRDCPYCGKAEIYVSQPKSWHDEDKTTTIAWFLGDAIGLLGIAPFLLIM